MGSVQPGGGVCYRVELAWGRLRRGYLRAFRPAYVRRMVQLRQGDLQGAPHAILDPRDLKYCGNRCQASWPPEADRFGWRARLPVARWGWAELLLIGGLLWAVALGLAWLPAPFGLSALVPVALSALLLVFFRDPPRRVPVGAGLVVAPADGTVVEITHLDDDPFIAGAAVRIGIFLSILDVHINRAPTRARVIQLEYQPGQFINALRARSTVVNEALRIALEEDEPPYRRMVVRQISGAIARRIVCQLRPGQRIGRGAKFGMIKLGSRTELILPAKGLSVQVAEGAHVKAGTTVLARFEPADET
ncbi:MAG: phosphatidylserine decarboxylase [Planctomycetes bacterium RBG_16_64_10]|nr:MAG: phosphatidylserine decarboxylase [Planctomycetes bacterium RBG_16_64_10]